MSNSNPNSPLPAIPFFPKHFKAQSWSRDGFFISTDPSLIPLATLNAAFGSDLVYWAKSLPEEALRDMLAHSLSFGLYAATGITNTTTTATTTDTTAGNNDDAGGGGGGGGGVDGILEGVLDEHQEQSVAETLHEIAASVRPPPAESNDDLIPGGTAPGPAPARQEKQKQGEGEVEPALIGFARLLTDGVTFAYLTDVYVLSDWQGQGLGNWLVGCVQEVLATQIPHLRRTVAIVGHGKESRLRFYNRIMGMTEVVPPVTVIQAKGPGNMF